MLRLQLVVGVPCVIATSAVIPTWDSTCLKSSPNTTFFNPASLFSLRSVTMNETVFVSSWFVTSGIGSIVLP